MSNLVFWDMESECIVTIEELANIFDNDPILQEEYENNFRHYIKACMVSEGGVLKEYNE